MSKTTIAGLLLLLLILLRMFWPEPGAERTAAIDRQDPDSSTPSLSEDPGSKDIPSSSRNGDSSSNTLSAIERRRSALRPDNAETHPRQDTDPSVTGTTPSGNPLPAESDEATLSGAQPMERAKKFEIKRFSADEVMALPRKDKTAFLDKNKLSEPDDYERFSHLPEVAVIDTYLKGQYRGKLEDKDGREWTLVLGIDGRLEGEHFTGDMAIEMLNQDNEPVGRSKTSGPLDSHFRVVDEGDRHSLLIIPSSRDNSKMYQIFISQSNKAVLAGNYYRKDENGKFQISGPFVLTRF